jgi:hypothetical protein
MILPGGQGINRNIDIAVTDLPQPDSPTTATVSPSSTVYDTPSTAFTTPADVKKCVCRSSISRSVAKDILPDKAYAYLL